MRLNTPVTQQEYRLGDDDLLISRTNLQGKITYANPAFVEASGFSLEELIGSDHNLVRHPDMPEEAFQNFWETIKQGQVWNGLVKNRRKNGDHYWVRANVVPVSEAGKVVGYASLRTCPSRAEVEHASKVYQRFKSHRAHGFRLARGQILRRGWHHRLLGIQWGAARTRITLLTMLATLPLLAFGVQQWRTGITADSALPLALASLLLAAILALGIGVCRSISRTLYQSRRFALQVAAGNLTVPVPAHGKDDMGQLVEALETMKKGLRGIVGDVNAGIERVRPSVDDIRRGNDGFSARTDSQAASIQQTASSMEQIASTVSQNADNAQQASGLALSNVREVESAGSGIAEMVKRMASITERSRQMSEVVSLIDSIAFQTNILALNASVEAARAGEQGRGFAVVASEVRSLASRSAEAAKEIHQLIANANQEIEAGANVVTHTESAIGRVIEASNRVNDIMEEISAASTEQSSGINQISDAISQMEQAVQQSAGQLQESAGATRRLQHETWLLNNAILAFRTRGSGQELQAEIDLSGSDRTPRAPSPATKLLEAAGIRHQPTTASQDDWTSF